MWPFLWHYMKVIGLIIIQCHRQSTCPILLRNSSLCSFWWLLFDCELHSIHSFNRAIVPTAYADLRFSLHRQLWRWSCNLWFYSIKLSMEYFEIPRLFCLICIAMPVYIWTDWCLIFIFWLWSFHFIFFKFFYHPLFNII